jgi:hypothetical protein
MESDDALCQPRHLLRVASDHLTEQNAGQETPGIR